MVRSRAYHPQTQGSVENANGTFKTRLLATSLEIGTRKWVGQLPDIISIINTTSNAHLPRHMTPYEVFFRRKPHWISPTPTPI